MSHRPIRIGSFAPAVASVVALLVGAANAQPTIGPQHYACASDSPFAGLEFNYFHLENFEGHALLAPGVTATGGMITSALTPNIHDSVDCDDGVIDGSGLAGDSLFAFDGVAGARFTFDESVLGALPTHVGIVWTDGGGDVTARAFALDGTLVGEVSGNTADTSVNGETAEDAFYGIISLDGIKSILVTSTAGGMELDHLQYGDVKCIPDYNQDGAADISDVLDMAVDISSGQRSFPPNSPDFNRDGSADISDLIDLGEVLGRGACL